jgi:hypothetical protein
MTYRQRRQYQVLNKLLLLLHLQLALKRRMRELQQRKLLQT